MDTHAAWTARHAEQDRLALLQLERKALCGCTRCGHRDRIEELDYLAAKSVALIAELTDRCCTREAVPCAQLT